MVKADLPYTYFNRKQLKSGWRNYWRFRRDGIDTPLPGQPGEPAFHARYAELNAEAEARDQAADRRAVDRHSFAWLCDTYLAGVEFAALAPKTQADYRRTIDDRLRPALGPERYDCIDRQSIKLIRDAVARTLSARTAHKVKQMAGRLYSWAEEEDLLPQGFTNPAQGIRKIKARAKPIHIWSAEEIALFLSRCEPWMKTVVLLALHTGQRREDLVNMTWSDCLGDVIRVRQNKTGEPLDLPCHRTLKAHLKRIRTEFGGKIIRHPSGKPLTADGLSTEMHQAVRAIPGMPHRSLHGLRYAAAGALEEAGCGVVEITSVIGHRTYQMAIKYARQRRDAQAAMRKLEAKG